MPRIVMGCPYQTAAGALEAIKDKNAPRLTQIINANGFMPSPELIKELVLTNQERLLEVSHPS